MRENQERIFIKGVENHRECYVKANYVEDKEHKSIQDVQAAEENICSLCNKPVRASEMGNASYVAGKPT